MARLRESEAILLLAKGRESLKNPDFDPVPVVKD